MVTIREYFKIVAPFNMKWISLLWSIVVLGFLVLLSDIISSRQSIQPLSSAFVIFYLFWSAISFVSPVILLLRLFRIIRSPASFIYILTGTVNIGVGITGLLYILPAENTRNNTTVLALFLLNMLLGSFIAFDAFIKTIPGFRKER